MTELTELLPVLDDDMTKCVKCGMCHAHDALYLASLDESLGTRGQLMLLNAAVREGAQVGDLFTEKMFCSLNSYDPQTNCPTGTPVLKILAQVRQHLLKTRGLQGLADMFGERVLAAVSASAAARQRAAVLAKVAAAELPAGNQWTDALRPLSDAGALAPATALELLPEVSPAKGTGRVAYLVGSLTNYAAPEIAQATVKVLNAAGYEVVTPKAQKCPGDLFVTLGDLDTAAALAAHNAAVFAEFDTVVTSCAATGAAVKNGLAGDDSGLSAKVRDVTELLAEGFAPRARLDRKVAYHDDCQLRAGMKVTKEPKALLTAAAGSNFVELAAADSASGAGEGPFSLFFAPLAQKITAKKVERIVESKADVVASGNVAAVLHLNEALERAGASARMKHTVELRAAVC